MAAVRAGRGPRAPQPGRLRHGSCAGMSRSACGCHGNACRRSGPGQGAYVGLNKTRSPPCMRCRGPCLAAPHRSASCLAFPMPRAARQSQEPARGSGFPTPPTSRSRLRAVPVSNGESISTASARDRASPLPHHFLGFSPVHTLSTECDWLPALNVGFPPPYAQPVNRLPGVTRRTPNRRATGTEKFGCRQIPLPGFAVCNTGNDLVISGSVGQGQFWQAASGRPQRGSVRR
jgi:hypothetical protein